MADFVTDGSNRGNRCSQRTPRRQAVMLTLSFCSIFLFLFCPRCKQVCISRPHNQRNCCLSESWTDLRSDSFRKGMCLAWRELRTNKLCQHSVCSLKSLSLSLSLSLCISIPLCVSTGLCLSNTATWLICSIPPISYILRLTAAFSLFSLHLHPLSLSSTKPPYCRHFHPHYSLPQPEPRQAGRQASRLGAQMVLRRVSQLWVSEPAGRQDGPSVADMAEAGAGTCL